ncbi:hypothetical protein [Polluticoccus soli]|uniref:hypothetical protein n=1 Tax=Polluticoccus soli TaxID=3034150 RepID=UPI0023E193CA|nr:hypothetical protein [Flavipsychrobacter sp. JY13-12]
MERWLKLLSFVVVFIVVNKTARCQVVTKPHRLLLILNGSAGMGASWQGQATKYKLASQLITGLAEEMYQHNDDIQMGLRVYGHLFPLSYNICKDSRQEVRFSKENHFQLGLRLADIKPTGKGELNYAFSEAIANELADTAHFQYSVIVVSDTGRQCQADNCLPAGKFYRKYLVEYGRATTTCYDSVFSGDPLKYRAVIDYIISQYPAKGMATIIQPPVRADTIRIPIYTMRKLTQTNTPPRSEVADRGTAIIYNTNQLYAIVLYVEEQGGYRKLDEIYFSGAASRSIMLGPGRYKAAFMANGVEHAKVFSVQKDQSTEVRVE